MINKSDLRQIVIFLVIVVITILVAQILSLLINRRLVKKNGLLLKDPTRLKFFAHVSTAIVYLIGFSTAISRIGFLQPFATSMLAGAGVITVAVSFASQNALSNIISGFFIVLFKPFGVNDRLKIKDNITGVVEDITLRHTVLRDGENKRVIIPNALMNNEVVVNYDFINENIKKSVDIILHCDSDLESAKKLIREIVMGHPKFVNNGDPSRLNSPEIAVPIYVTNVSEKGIHLQIIIIGRAIVESNEIAFALLETLITEMPKVGAYFVHHLEMTKAGYHSPEVDESHPDTNTLSNAAGRGEQEDEIYTISEPGAETDEAETTDNESNI